MRISNTWTADRTEQLRLLWPSAMTAVQIARRLNLPSKNAVIGKAHRLGLPLKGKAYKVVPPMADSLFAARAAKATACVWPIGDPTSEDFHYCGEKPVEGKPYCQHHCNVAYRPDSRKKQRALTY